MMSAQNTHQQHCYLPLLAGCRRGFAFLFTSYIVVFVLFMLTTVLLNRVSMEMRNAERTVDQQRSFWAAEAAIDQGFYMLATAPAPLLGVNECEEEVNVLSGTFSSAYYFCNVLASGGNGTGGEGGGSARLGTTGGGSTVGGSETPEGGESAGVDPECLPGTVCETGAGGEESNAVYAIYATGQPVNGPKVNTQAAVRVYTDDRVVVDGRLVIFNPEAEAPIIISGAPVRTLASAGGIVFEETDATATIELEALYVAQSEDISAPPENVTFTVGTLAYNVQLPELEVDCAPPAGAIDLTPVFTFPRDEPTTIDLEAGTFVVTADVNFPSGTQVNVPPGNQAVFLYFTGPGEQVLSGVVMETNATGVSSSEEGSQVSAVNLNLYVKDADVRIADATVRAQLFSCGQGRTVRIHESDFGGTIRVTGGTIIIGGNTTITHHDPSNQIAGDDQNPTSQGALKWLAWNASELISPVSSSNGNGTPSTGSGGGGTSTGGGASGGGAAGR